MRFDLILNFVFGYIFGTFIFLIAIFIISNNGSDVNKSSEEKITSENWECHFYDVRTGQCTQINRKVKP